MRPTLIQRAVGLGAIGAALLAASSAQAQSDAGGRVAGSSVGQVGQRQGRDLPAINGAPAGRINGRIESRVQSRIRNRIDRNYSAQTDTASSFAAAGAQLQTAGRP